MHNTKGSGRHNINDSTQKTTVTTAEAVRTKTMQLNRKRVLYSVRKIKQKIKNKNGAASEKQPAMLLFAALFKG